MVKAEALSYKCNAKEAGYVMGIYCIAATRRSNRSNCHESKVDKRTNDYDEGHAFQ